MKLPFEGAVRPTLRCLREDLGVQQLPSARVALSDVDHPAVERAQAIPIEVRNNAAVHIDSIEDRRWYRKAHSSNTRRIAVTELKDSDSPTLIDEGAAWWIGAEGPRRADSNDDFYQQIAEKCRREAKGTAGRTDSTWMLPRREDVERLQLELVVLETLRTHDVIQNTLALSLVNGGTYRAEVQGIAFRARARRGEPGECYLAIGAAGFTDPRKLAMLLTAVPNVDAATWGIEHASDFLPAERGEIVWSTFVDPEVCEELASRTLPPVEH